MIKRIFSVAALSLMVAACGGDEGAEGEVVDKDTTTVQGTDTVTQQTVVPATDTVVKTTTVDTVHGQGQAPAGDTARDTTKQH